MRWPLHALALALLAPCVVGVSLADERHHRDDRGHRDSRPEWHGDIGRFREHDMTRWSGGRWHHGHHDGRNGWWWIVGAAWYFYPTRVAPYPDPYLPPVVVVPPAPAPAPIPVQYWYYCANPAGYYPYVAQCAVDWQRVEATAPTVAQPR